MAIPAMEAVQAVAPAMGFPIGAVASGIAGLAGGFFQNAANRAAADRSMAFSERMSSTAYQRAVQDMRMAGINPILAAGQGGASSPGGVAPQMSDVIGPAVSSAQHARQLQNELDIGKLTKGQMFTDLQRKGNEARVSEIEREIAESTRGVREQQIRKEAESQNEFLDNQKWMNTPEIRIKRLIFGDGGMIPRMDFGNKTIVLPQR